MARKHFFERMEREIDFQNEYKKIENIILNEPGMGKGFSINDEISKDFREWKDRGNFISFDELRKYLGFTYRTDRWTYEPTGSVNGIDDFLLYCEMLLNLFLIIKDVSYNKRRIATIVDTMIFDFEKINHQIYTDNNNKVYVIQKNAASTAVADLVEPILADEIIKYNHYLLKGDIVSKKAILKNIVDALEPKRADLKSINKTIESDLFYMVNKFDIRHNNCDLNDPSKYNEKFAKLTDKEKEEWYDEVYQQALMAFMMLEQPKRTKKIAMFKS